MKKVIIAAAAISALSMTAAYAKSIPARDFVQKASVANEFEIESSDLALHKSQNDDVKSFAQHMVDDHTKIGDNLKQALQDAHSSLTPEETLDDKHQDLLDKLDEAPGHDFDHEYIAIQAKAHKEAVSLFSDYARHGRDKQLKHFAFETLPTLKEHLKEVTRLKAGE